MAFCIWSLKKDTYWLRRGNPICFFSLSEDFFENISFGLKQNFHLLVTLWKPLLLWLVENHYWFFQLHLQEGGLHADINGDGVLDHVQVHMVYYILMFTSLWGNFLDSQLLQYVQFSSKLFWILVIHVNVLLSIPDFMGEMDTLIYFAWLSWMSEQKDMCLLQIQSIFFVT